MKTLFQKITLIVLLVALTAVLAPTPLLAEGGKNITDTMKSKLENFSTLPSGDEDTAQKIIGQLIAAFLSVMGVIFLVLMIYGGYRWMMASGREEEVKKAKDTIRSAIIGLIIVLSAYAITYFISKSLESAVQ